MFDLPFAAKVVNIIGLSITFCGALVLARPWAPILFRFQLALNRYDRNQTHRSIRAMETKFDKMAGRQGYYNVGRLAGHFSGQRLNAAAVDKLHQVTRKSHSLPPLSLRTNEIIAQDLVEKSYREIDAKIREDYLASEPRDFSGVGVWLLALGFLLQLFAAFGT